ncbi:MAG: vitamin B12 dependent-methionine synthase activation domain-containing protein [Candidatus Hodarchaeales archaeon]|jgi:hypothetical protein
MVNVEIAHNFQISEEELAYILSGGRKDLPLTNNILSTVNEYKDRIDEYLNPKAIYKVLPKEDLPERPYFADMEEVVIALCTIGPILPSKVNMLLQKNDTYNATILDSIGSVAAEELAEIVNAMIVKELGLVDNQISTRYSPGYCTVPVTEQSIIFAHIDGNSIGIILTEGYLMTPIKSVSFFLNLGPNVKKSKWEKRCQACGKVCSYRREPRLDTPAAVSG